MKIVELNLNPTDRQLRQFGAICLVALPFLGWFFGGWPGMSIAWEIWHTKLIGGLALAGAVLAGVGLLRPRILKPVFVGLSLLFFPVGLVVGEVVLAVIYFGLFTPVALVFRLVGRDVLQRDFDEKATTYWQPISKPRQAESYFRQS